MAADGPITADMEKPYPGDGLMHCILPPSDGRALPRCGHPAGQSLAMDVDYQLSNYPTEDLCPTCLEMAESGEAGPREWTGG